MIIDDDKGAESTEDANHEVVEEEAGADSAKSTNQNQPNQDAYLTPEATLAPRTLSPPESLLLEL